MTIKTQGGKVILKDGKVSCECCCSCQFAIPINPEEDPDFTKKLIGEDFSVAPFANVNITYNITATIDDFTASISGSHSGTWDLAGSECLGLKKVLTLESCEGGLCGEYFDCDISDTAIGNIELYLTSNNCLFFRITEVITNTWFYIAQPNCDKDNICPVTINGQIYQTNSVKGFVDTVTGSATIIFS